MGLLAKISHFPPQEMIFARSVLAIVASLFLLRQKNLSPLVTRHELPWLLLRGLFGYGALSLFFASLAFIPLGVASVLQYLSPIFGSVFAFFFLGERLRGLQVVGLGLGFLGVLAILGFGLTLPGQGFAWWAVLGCCLSACLSGAAYVMVRRLSSQGEEDRDIIILYFHLLMLCASALTFVFGWSEFQRPEGLVEWLLLLGVMFSSYLGQLALTMSFQAGKTAIASNALFSGAFFSTILGLVFCGDSLTWGFLLGGVFILGAQYLMNSKAKRAERST